MKEPSKFSWEIAEQELDFKRGGLINIGWYCTDRICLLGKAAKTALIHEDSGGITRSYSFNDLRLASNTAGTFLTRLGLRNGDRICLFMDRTPDLYFYFLGALKAGIIVQPLFSAFGDESLFVRLKDAGTRAVITQQKHLFKIRKIRDRLPSLEFIIITDHPAEKELTDRELAADLSSMALSEQMEVYPSGPHTPSILHYTSGTTGQPKGVIHTHYSLVSQYFTAKHVLDLKEDDIYWCTADPGWVTGTSYGIIGPWSAGVTQCILDMNFSATRWYEFIEKRKITVWYTAPTAIRYLMKAGPGLLGKYCLSSLRHLCSVGEPLNAAAVKWSQKYLGKPFHDTFWQTETGSIMICNLPGMEIKPGSMGKPFPGIESTLLDPVTHVPLKTPGVAGMMAFRPGWPAQMTGYWNDNVKYREKFIDGWYVTGDRAMTDNDGYYWFIGRDDDVINTGGHLVSPFEVESALLEHPAVAESAVIAKPDVMMMEVVKAYVSLKPGFDKQDGLDLEIMNLLRKKLSPLAMPQEIEFIDHLPKTRSGKIMRRYLHMKEWHEKEQDLSGLDTED
ncbi:MAG TPA: AMP-binding protein [Bacteroidales bacterium]|nr:AMP-binding protein [Bacteroidales bacterium]